MSSDKYDFAQIEPEILSFWEKEQVYEQLRGRTNAKPFYFLDGPPYTSGKVHIGTAWNKSLKDALVRCKRMQGYRVWDRAGYDMHGLPTEQATEKHLELHSKEEIHSFGLSNFIGECKRLSKRNLQQMNVDFTRIGASLDFERAYQTASEEYTDAVWWLVKRAYENDRLYEGKRPMAWDVVTESAMAKHELFYKSVEDTSIYVKFKRAGTDNEYFIVWTTTPWTIPFNLMIMMHPEKEYARVQVGSEIWILAAEREDAFLEIAGVSGTRIDTLFGAEFDAAGYEHFLQDDIDYTHITAQHDRAHTVVLSKEYVTTDSGTGLVHAAPGCGPEDYEVGVQYDVPAFNTLDVKGRFPEDMPLFAGKVARQDDRELVELYEQRGVIAASEQYVHDYPHAERSKAPVIFKTTKQWFFKVADLKPQMIALNNTVKWIPKSGYNAYNSWLENLRDNSITKQRFWGTPFPVWRNVDDPDDVIVIGSRQELEQLTGATIPDLHKPVIDAVKIVKDGKTYQRIPDIIDVWVDAGVALWASLGFPQDQDTFDRYMKDYGADFILEGRDQIRGWFNLLMVASVLGFSVEKPPFKAVYMHGMINDSQGRKMSKSVGNYITPDEVVEQFGADACRLYWIGGARAGNDLNYNFSDCQTKHRTLFVMWNMHNYTLDLNKTYGLVAEDVSTFDLTVEDKYMLSKTHSAMQRVEKLISTYEIDRIPEVVEQLMLTISRTYIQLVRDKAQESDEQNRIFSVLMHCYSKALLLLAPICPFISEKIWQNMQSLISDTTKSVHLMQFSQVEPNFIDTDLEQEFEQTENALSVILSARDKAKIGVRWPLQLAELRGVTLSAQSVERIQQQANIKEVRCSASLNLVAHVKPDYKALGRDFGQDTATIASYIGQHAEVIGSQLQNGEDIVVEGKKLEQRHLSVSYSGPEETVFAEAEGVQTLLHTKQTDSLLQEGYARELVRRIQQLRKQQHLSRKDRISLYLDPSLKDVIGSFDQDIATRVGANSVTYADPSSQPHSDEQKVKGTELRFGFRVE